MAGPAPYQIPATGNRPCDECLTEGRGVVAATVCYSWSGKDTDEMRLCDDCWPMHRPQPGARGFW